jgi:hypothetical protein
MKDPIVVGIMVFSVLLAGCGKKSVADKEVPPYHGQTFTKSADDDFIASEQKVADSSQVIAYASADTNQMPSIVLTVSEIWKGAHDAATLGITNGTQFSLGGSSVRGPLPDGAIVLIPQADSPSVALEQRRVTFVRSGRILDMTIKEYKTRLGI